MSERRRGLGRGLGALIPTDPRAGEADDERLPGRGRPLDRLGAGPSPRPGPAPAGGAVPSVVDLRGHDDRGHDDTAGDDAAHESTAPEDAAGDDSREDAAPGSASTPAVLRRPPDLVPVPGVRFAEVAIGAITPNPRQPRLDFDVDALGELALSIREVGVLQPVVLRPIAGADEAADGTADDGADATAYELVMGERRWRAAELAGLTTVPALVRNTSDDSLLRDALLENLHRVQLNPLEEGAAYQQLLDDFGCTHDQLAQRLGRSRPQISNTIRLLRLPPAVQRRVAAGVISAGHARALLGLSDPAAMERLAQRIVAEGLSVRATEEVVALGGEGTAPRRTARRSGSSGGQPFVDLAERLSDRFDTRVSVAMGQSKGRLTVEFAGVEDLNRILERLAPEDPGLGETLPG